MSKEYIAPIGEELYWVATGDWRTHYPKLEQSLCRKCGICLMNCPVNSIRLENGKYLISLDFCKGCGICAHECPHGAITLHKEASK